MARSHLGSIKTSTEGMRFYQEVGQRIRAERHKRRMSQSDLAVKIGVSRPTLLHWELGKQRVSLYALREISETLDVEIQRLIPPVWDWGF